VDLPMLALDFDFIEQKQKDTTQKNRFNEFKIWSGNSLLFILLCVCVYLMCVCVWFMEWNDTPDIQRYNNRLFYIENNGVQRVDFHNFHNWAFERRIVCGVGSLSRIVMDTTLLL
jgi:hypothetical protein